MPAWAGCLSVCPSACLPADQFACQSFCMSALNPYLNISFSLAIPFLGPDAALIVRQALGSYVLWSNFLLDAPLCFVMAVRRCLTDGVTGWLHPHSACPVFLQPATYLLTLTLLRVSRTTYLIVNSRRSPGWHCAMPATALMATKFSGALSTLTFFFGAIFPHHFLFR